MKRVYVDSSVWISRFEGLPIYRERINSVWADLIRDEWEVCISGFVTLEALCKPIQKQSVSQQLFYETLLNRAYFLDHYDHLISDAMSVMKREKLNAMDSLHVAIASRYQCRLFMTSDSHFKHISVIPVKMIDLPKVS